MRNTLSWDQRSALRHMDRADKPLTRLACIAGLRRDDSLWGLEGDWGWHVHKRTLDSLERRCMVRTEADGVAITAYGRAVVVELREYEEARR